MANHDDRSGMQTAVDLARMAKAAVRIARAAATAGLHGAAVAAAKEALPFLVKVVIAVLIVLIAVPMVVFTALPNIFFGYESSDTDSVAYMTQQAMTIGGAYMSLEEFEHTQVDSVVTSIVNEYESQGKKIDRIKVVDHFDEDDLIWLIAINSASHQQDLNAMSAVEIRNFCVSRLTYSPSLVIIGEGDASETTLTITVEKLDPEKLMEDLGFDAEAQTWAGALYETLKESDAIQKYGPYFKPYQPDYSGDSGYDGEASHGSSYGNDIDISKFVSPETKNNVDLAAYAVQAWENNWGYVWGTYGNVLTRSLLDYKIQQYPDGVGAYKDFIEENWLGRRTTDCVGLIKGYGWLDPTDQSIDYASNGMPDYGANQMYQSAVDAGADHGSMSTMPDIVGLAVWKEGHIGVYIGDGYVVEAMSTKKGVVKTKVEGRGWQGWCKIPYIDYLEE